MPKQRKAVIMFCLMIITAGSLLAQNRPVFRTGLIVPTQQEYEKTPKYKISPSRLAEALPSAVDLSDGLPPVGDQDQQGSCASWAIGYYAKTYQEGRERGWDLTSPDHQFSPAFIYNHINGGQDNGSDLSTPMNFIKAHGCATLSEVPYDDEDYSSWPGAEVYKNALQYRSDSFSRIERVENEALDRWEFTDEGIATMKQILADGNVFVLGIPMDSVFAYKMDSVGFVYDTIATDLDTGYIGWHAVCIVGYDDTVGSHGAFRMVNSWNETWADSGFAWLGYNFVKFSRTFAYVMEDRTDYSPTALARLNFSHANRGDLRASVFVMDSDANVDTLTVFDMLGGDHGGFDMWVDVSDLTASLPPAENHRFVLSLLDRDGDANVASLNDFYIEYQGTEYRPESSTFESLDNGLAQVSISGANVPAFSPIGGEIMGTIPEALSPYLVFSDLDASDSVLAIEPGAQLYFADSTGLNAEVKTSIRGTETDTVRFLPYNQNPSVAIWDGLFFNSCQAELAYCDVRYADRGIAYTNREVNDTAFLRLSNSYLGECVVGADCGLTEGADVTVSGSRMENNICGISGFTTSFLLSNNFVVNNDSMGIQCGGGGSPSIVNNTVIGNSLFRGGVYLEDTRDATVRNNIIAYNGYGISLERATNTMSDYNNLWSNSPGADYEGLSAGEHDINVDPGFVDAQAGDYHLQLSSPCIDSGDPESEYSGEPSPNGGRINLGAYGNTSEAALSLPLYVDALGDVIFSDTTGAYDIWVELNDVVADPSVSIIYSVDGGGTFGDTLLCNLADERYSADLPARSWGTDIYYYFETTDSSDDIERLPQNAPDEYYTLRVSEYMTGDLDGDSNVNIFDLLALLRQINDENQQNDQGDVNLNGKVDIFDLLQLLKIIKGSD